MSRSTRKHHPYSDRKEPLPHQRVCAIDDATKTTPCGKPLVAGTPTTRFAGNVTCHRCIKALKRKERGL